MAEWERKGGLLAVRAGDDALAKEALARKGEHDKMQAEFGKQWQLQKDAVEKLKDQLRTLNDKIEEAKRKKNILIARQKRAVGPEGDSGHDARGLSDNSAFESFERMDQKVAQIEAESEASAELGGELAGDTLQQKFKKLEGGDRRRPGVLAELKAKMGLGPAPERPALTSGRRRAQLPPHPNPPTVSKNFGSCRTYRIVAIRCCEGTDEPMPQHQNHTTTRFNGVKGHLFSATMAQERENLGEKGDGVDPRASAAARSSIRS